MAGQIKRLLEEIIKQRAKGDTTLMSTTKTKLILKGFNPDKYTAASEDNPEVIQRIRAAAAEMGVKV
jgi:hypothetical protein